MGCVGCVVYGVCASVWGVWCVCSVGGVCASVWGVWCVECVVYGVGDIDCPIGHWKNTS